MSTDNAKPRAKAANSSSPRRPASTSSPSNRSSSVRRAPAADANASAPTARAKKPLVRKRKPKAKNPPVGTVIAGLILRKRRGKPVLVGQALRTQGFDEHVAATEFIALAQALALPNAKATAANKMRFDVLKECTKQLENAQKVERSAEEAAADAPVYFQLVHTVPRPSRGPQVDGESSLGDQSPREARDPDLESRSDASLDESSAALPPL